MNRASFGNKLNYSNNSTPNKDLPPTGQYQMMQ